MKKLHNKVAVITGGNSGIGLETVKNFLNEGAKVAFTGRRKEALEAASSDLNLEHLTILADAKDISKNKEVYEKVEKEYGKIDVLFLNAGIGTVAPFAQTTPEIFDDVISTNLRGPYFAIQEALPYLNDGASIILNASIADQKGMAGMTAYSVSKAGLRNLARGLAVELKEQNIRTNVISPGPIQTPIYGKIGLSEEQINEWGKGLAEQIPLGRFGKPEEIAQAAVFLASNESSFVNSIELEVDGGMSQI